MGEACRKMPAYDPCLKGLGKKSNVFFSCKTFTLIYISNEHFHLLYVFIKINLSQFSHCMATTKDNETFNK